MAPSSPRRLAANPSELLTGDVRRTGLESPHPRCALRSRFCGPFRMEIAVMFTPLLVSMLATAEPAATRAAATSAASCCAVLELRQYTLKPGQRDVLVTLFEREFVETQEAVGMHLVGQFR